jgi:hypothetical protein
VFDFDGKPTEEAVAEYLLFASFSWMRCDLLPVEPS